LKLIPIPNQRGLLGQSGFVRLDEIHVRPFPLAVSVAKLHVATLMENAAKSFLAWVVV